MIVMLYGKNGEKLYSPTFCTTDVGLGIRVKLTVLVDDGKNPPYKASCARLVTPGIFTSLGDNTYGVICTELIREIMASELMPPVPCECQSREWLEAHPGDIQEYWRTIDGLVYAKDHTNLCPKNPKNRSKND